MWSLDCTFYYIYEFGKKMWHKNLPFDPGSPMKTERFVLGSKTSFRWVRHGINQNPWINFCINAIRQGGPLLLSAIVVSLMWATIAANNQVQRSYTIKVLVDANKLILRKDFQLLNFEFCRCCRLLRPSASKKLEISLELSTQIWMKLNSYIRPER